MRFIGADRKNKVSDLGVAKQDQWQKLYERQHSNQFTPAVHSQYVNSTTEQQDK